VGGVCVCVWWVGISAAVEGDCAAGVACVRFGSFWLGFGFVYRCQMPIEVSAHDNWGGQWRLDWSPAGRVVTGGWGSGGGRHWWAANGVIRWRSLSRQLSFSSLFPQPFSMHPF